METLRAFALLLLAQLAGEGVQRALHLPLPGPVLGMAFLAAYLILRRREPPPALVNTSNHLLKWFGLLFIPAGAAVFAQLGLLRQNWLPVVLALLGSTFLTVAVTAFVLHRLSTGGASAE